MPLRSSGMHPGNDRQDRESGPTGLGRWIFGTVEIDKVFAVTLEGS
jgi:hypothetical protein